MGKLLILSLLLVWAGPVCAGDNDEEAPTANGLGPYTASLSAYSATDPQRKGQDGRSKTGSCNGTGGPNESPSGKKPLDLTYDKGGGGDVMVAATGFRQFKNCRLNIPGLGSRFVVLDHMPGRSGLSGIDISHYSCEKAKAFGRRSVSGIYVIKGPGCNPDRTAKKPAKRRVRRKRQG